MLLQRGASGVEACGDSASGGVEAWVSRPAAGGTWASGCRTEQMKRFSFYADMLRCEPLLNLPRLGYLPTLPSLARQKQGLHPTVFGSLAFLLLINSSVHDS